MTTYYMKILHFLSNASLIWVWSDLLGFGFGDEGLIFVLVRNESKTLIVSLSSRSGKQILQLLWLTTLSSWLILRMVRKQEQSCVIKKGNLEPFFGTNFLLLQVCWSVKKSPHDSHVFWWPLLSSACFSQLEPSVCLLVRRQHYCMFLFQ